MRRRSCSPVPSETPILRRDLADATPFRASLLASLERRAAVAAAKARRRRREMAGSRGVVMAAPALALVPAGPTPEGPAPDRPAPPAGPVVASPSQVPG